MSNYSVSDTEDSSRFRLLLSIPYNDLLSFVMEYIRKKSPVMAIFWASCTFFMFIAVYIRISISDVHPFSEIFLHSVLGFVVFPILCVPFHEGLHILPYFLSGARNIRIGMDLKQYLFYVTAHRHVAAPREFKMVAAFPYQLISVAAIFLVFFLPDLWKWSFSAFLFAHATMCAGDFALLNFYYLNRDKQIYTWDDADKKEAYFYEKLA
ncbi:MAG TPA: DUF3267 domain-containing protein [Bacteroidales bacterium]|jgi:hypothetical protein|nr:DUF3267 domain-containing protein [Bacteroidales bacterium]